MGLEHKVTWPARQTREIDRGLLAVGRFAAVTNIIGLTQLKVISLPSKVQNGCSAGRASPLQVVIRDPGSFHAELCKWRNHFHSYSSGCSSPMDAMSCKGAWEMWRFCSQGEEDIDLRTAGWFGAGSDIFFPRGPNTNSDQISSSSFASGQPPALPLPFRDLLTGKPRLSIRPRWHVS